MNKRISSRAVIIDNSKLLTMFRRKVNESGKLEYYVIPGGGVEKGETLEETVVRELKEEMNVDIEILGYLGKLEKEKTIEHYFHCQIVSGSPKLSGEELDRMSDSNYYEPMFIELDNLKNINIQGLDIVNKAINKQYEN